MILIQVYLDQAVRDPPLAEMERAIHHGIFHSGSKRL